MMTAYKSKLKYVCFQKIQFKHPTRHLPLNKCIPTEIFESIEKIIGHEGQEGGHMSDSKTPTNVEFKNINDQ